MKKWKKQCNSQLREYLKNTDVDFSGHNCKKFINRWTAPDDGRSYWDTPKAYRK
jgi:hypothetical protein